MTLQAPAAAENKKVAMTAAATAVEQFYGSITKKNSNCNCNSNSNSNSNSKQQAQEKNLAVAAARVFMRKLQIKRCKLLLTKNRNNRTTAQQVTNTTTGITTTIYHGGDTTATATVPVHMFMMLIRTQEPTTSSGTIGTTTIGTTRTNTTITTLYSVTPVRKLLRSWTPYDGSRNIPRWIGHCILFPHKSMISKASTPEHQDNRTQFIVTNNKIDKKEETTCWPQ